MCTDHYHQRIAIKPVYDGSYIWILNLYPLGIMCHNVLTYVSLIRLHLDKTLTCLIKTLHDTATTDNPRVSLKILVYVRSFNKESILG